MQVYKTASQILLLTAGGAIGTLLRYFVYVVADKHFNHAFPWGTLIVNLTGSFAIGLLWGFFDRGGVPPALRLFVFIGILGSFTTFSTFAFDSVQLLNRAGAASLLLNVLLNNLGGLILCYAGILLTSR